MSASNNQSDIWQTRQKILEAKLTALNKTWPSDTPQKDVFVGLLDGLRKFARPQFNYFYRMTKSPTDKYPREYALGATMHQIAYDIEVIERAACQRFSGCSSILEALRMTDELADQALQPAIGSRLLPKSTRVLTYFEKSPSVRVIPYGEVALIGVPYTCAEFDPQDGSNSPKVSLTTDILASPHEVGHYVFWHGLFTSDNLHVHNALQKDLSPPSLELEKWARRWVEEVFADVYGCMVAGSEIARSFQDLQINRSKKDFITDDQDHPIPALRPYLHIKALEKTGRADDAGQLEERWKKILKGKNYPEQFSEFKPGWVCRVLKRLFKSFRCDEQPIQLYDEAQLKSALGEANKIVEAAHNRLKNIEFPSMWPDTSPEASASRQQPANRAIQSSEPSVPTTEESWGRWKERLLAENSKISDDTTAFFASEKEREWTIVLRAGGWTTEGPGLLWP